MTARVDISQIALDGQIMTKNQKGFDMGKPSYKIEEWISAYDFSKPEYPLVDVGCGLGTNVLKALSHGAKVIAIDMTEDHLSEIREKAGNEATSSGQLKTKIGKLPDEVNLPEASASGILCAQVIHFLTPEAVKTTFQRFYKALIPGGKLLVLASSHYISPNILSGKTAQIDAQIKEDGEDNPDSFPGFVPDGTASLMQEIEHLFPEEIKQAIPTVDSGPFQTFTGKQLGAIAKKTGFTVVEAGLADGALSNYPTFIRNNQDGTKSKDATTKEMAYVVAQKPL